MEILGFGTYDRRRHPRAGIILDGLALTGARVTEINEPLGLSTSDRVDLLRRPRNLYRLAAHLARCWLGLARRARAERAAPDAVVVGYLGQFDVIAARLLFRRSTVVLDQLVFGADTARDRNVGSRPVLAVLDALERLACRCSDLVVVDTEEDSKLLPAAAAGKVVVVPVGAPAAWFQAGRGRRGAPPAGPGRADPAQPLTVVFYGLYTPLQGARFLARAIRSLAGEPGIRFTMVGTGQEFPEVRAEAGDGDHVTWLGWVDPEALPALVAGHDVCLGIFGTTPKAARVVPNKVYQGAAAGCALVTSDTAPQRRALGAAALYVPAGRPDAIARAICDLRDDRDGVRALQTAAAEVAATDFTPEAVVRPLLPRLKIGPLGP